MNKLILIMGLLLPLMANAKVWQVGNPGPWPAKSGAGPVIYRGPAEVVYTSPGYYQVYRPGFYAHGPHMYYRHQGYYRAPVVHHHPVTVCHRGHCVKR